MSELTELLAAEATRRQPTHRPPFADLVRRRRRRDRRTRLILGAVMVLVLGALAGPALLRPEKPVPSGPVAGVTVTGTLQFVGGPMGAGSFGAAGTVHFEADDGTVTVAMAGIDGSFSVTVPPGRYTVAGDPYQASSPPGVATGSTGGSPQHPPSSSANVIIVVPTKAWSPRCRADAPVIVPAGGLSGVEVNCQMR